MLLKTLALAGLTFFSVGPKSGVQTFATPIDAVSVAFTSHNQVGSVRYYQNSQWSEWNELHVENEQDPTLLESNLVLFPVSVKKIELRGNIAAIHPINVADARIQYNVAALSNTNTPRILTRAEWGADETLRYRSSVASSASTSTTPADTAGDNGGATSQRAKDCEEAQLNYPNEFKTNGRLVKEEDGHTLRWPRTYSKDMKLLTVHHTAMQADGDTRSGVERMQALYEYHAENRGWGDIGYHYLIDEDGQIYEGKAGGKYVIGGHAYCNNTNTLGIALLGNFDVEQPTQKQMKALQWLVIDLGETYNIDLNAKVQFHGKTLDPVIGHRDLLSTDCPGFYLYGALSQILHHAADNDPDADIRMPKKPQSSSSSRSSRAKPRTTVTRNIAPEGPPRRVARLLDTEASKNLRRKLGSNPGRKTEEGVEARKTGRLSGSSVSRSSKSIARSSISRSPAPQSAKRSDVGSSTTSKASLPSQEIRIRLTSVDASLASCTAINLDILQTLYRGTVTCVMIDTKPTVINTVSLEDYLLGLAEEPDTEPYEKQRAFAIAARTYAAWYLSDEHRKFPNMPYDGSDSPATFQKYTGRSFETNNPRWLKAVRNTDGIVLTYEGELIKPPYFSSDDGRTRAPKEAGWNSFPFADIFTSKPDPWCDGMELRGHGVGMSGCGAEGQANEGKTAEEILQYYYPGTKNIVLQ